MLEHVHYVSLRTLIHKGSNPQEILLLDPKLISLDVIYIQCVGLYLFGQLFTKSTIIETIRIYHECKGQIEKFVPMITVWHHEACRMMTNGDLEGRIFLEH